MDEVDRVLGTPEDPPDHVWARVLAAALDPAAAAAPPDLVPGGDDLTDPPEADADLDHEIDVESPDALPGDPDDDDPSDSPSEDADEPDDWELP